MGNKGWKTGFAFKLPRGDRYSLELVKQTAKSEMTFQEAWEAYKPVSNRDNRSWKSDRARAKRLIKHLGDTKIEEMSLETVEKYRVVRSQEVTYRGTTPTPCTLNHEVKLLRHVINYMVEIGNIEKNPIAKVKLLRENNVRASVITEEQLTALLRVADDDLRPIILVAYDTGMRKSEILKLRWVNVDLHEGVVIVAETKNDEPRAVYLTGRAKAELQQLPRSISGYVFVNPRTNKPWVDIKKKWNRAREAAGVEELWFHDHRRSFVTNARRRGVPESVVMKISGHKTRTVFDRYNVVSVEDVKNAIVQIEQGREKAQAQEKKAA